MPGMVWKPSCVEAADETGAGQGARPALAGAAVLLAIWVCFASWCALSAMPRPQLLWVTAIVATVASLLGCFELTRRSWSIPLVRRWPLTSTGIALSVGVATMLLTLPGFGLLFAIAAVLFAACGLLVLALASLMFVNRRLDAAFAVLSVVGVALVVVAGWWPLQEAGLRFRLALVENHYRAEAARLVAQPAITHDGPVNGHIVYREESGTRAMVAWRWRDGIPARVFGVVYDPQGLLDDGVKTIPDAGSLWLIHGCSHMHGPWHWCRIY